MKLRSLTGRQRGFTTVFYLAAWQGKKLQKKETLKHIIIILLVPSLDQTSTRPLAVSFQTAGAKVWIRGLDPCPLLHFESRFGKRRTDADRSSGHHPRRPIFHIRIIIHSKHLNGKKHLPENHSCVSITDKNNKTTTCTLTSPNHPCTVAASSSQISPRETSTWFGK